MQYSALINIIKEHRNSDGKEFVTIPVEMFRNLLVTALRSRNEFEEHFYINQNSDISEATQNKSIPSAADHYFVTGYFEGRMPKKILVDERFYLTRNPDVADAIKRGVIKTAQDHFDYTGFHEGRIPYEGFSLF